MWGILELVSSNIAKKLVLLRQRRSPKTCRGRHSCVVRASHAFARHLATTVTTRQIQCCKGAATSLLPTPLLWKQDEVPARGAFKQATTTAPEHSANLDNGQSACGIKASMIALVTFRRVFKALVT
eukprot:932185-Amphidinium_carterae.2